jgi:hypothetical protein
MARSLLHICLVTFLLTTAWAILLIVDMAGAGPLEGARKICKGN